MRLITEMTMTDGQDGRIGQMPERRVVDRNGHLLRTTRSEGVIGERVVLSLVVERFVEGVDEDIVVGVAHLAVTA